MTLVALLILVLVCMDYAAKPETWERLGFRDPEKANSISEDDGTAIEIKPDTKPQDLGLSSDKSDNDVKLTIQSSENPYWCDFYDQLGVNHKLSFQRLLRFARIQQPLPSQYLEDSTTIVAQAGAFQKQFFDRYEDQDRKQKLEQVLEAKKAIATVGIGEELPADQRTILLAIEAQLLEFIRNDVKDHTGMKRPADGPAWNSAWESVLTQPITHPISVSHRQLMSQPKFYRLKPVAIEGVVRGAQRIEFTPNEMGLTSYYIIWIEPAQAGVSPICVYSHDVPEGFEHVGEEFEFFEKRVRVEGIFFKIRTYQTKMEEIESCPLVLCKSFIPIQVTNNEAIATTDWKPEAWYMIPFLILVPLAVGVWAYLAYQGTKMRRPNHAKIVRDQIDDALRDLSDDPSIKSDAERVRELGQNATD